MFQTMSHQRWDSQVLQTAVQLAQKALQDAFKPAGLEIPQRAPEAHRSWGAVPDQEQPESAPDEMNSAAALIQNIVTTCDTALTAHFRHLSQLKRQSILDEIQRAADAAKNAVLQSGQDQLLGAKMIQISGMSGQDLCQKLPALLESGLRLDVIACALHCDTDHILATIAEKEAIIAQLQRQVATLQTQPGGHQDRIKNGEPVRPVVSPPLPLPGKSRPKIRSSDPNACDTSVQPRGLSRSRPSYKEDATKTFRHRQRSRSSSRTLSETTSRCRTTGNSAENQSVLSHTDNKSTCSNCSPRKADVLCALKEVLKTQSVADVGVYDGSSSFDDFIRRLEVKYPSTLWSDEDKKKILLTHLGGTIRALIDTSPEMGHNTSYQSVVKFLREARRTPGERLQAEMDWKNLRIMDDESVADFVCRMRQIARRMAPEQAMDFQLGSKLYECLAHWKDSYYMLAALEAPEGQVFQEVRTVALRLERVRIAQKAIQSPSGNRRQAGVPSTAHQASSVDSSASSPPPSTAGWSSRSRNGNRRRRQRHKPQPTRPSNGQATQPGGIRPPNLAVTGASRSNRSGQKQSLAALLDSWCAAIAVPGVPTKPFGKPCHCTIRIMGTKAKALIDTGSVLSIIPTGFLYPLKEKGEDLDSMVTLLGPPRDNSILDVSGNRMKFLMRLDTQVTLQPGGKETKVQFHIQKADRQLILLGTNALQALGVGLQFNHSGWQLTHQKRNEPSTRKGQRGKGRKARAKSTVTIAPLTVANAHDTHPGKDTDKCFWSKDSRIGPRLRHITNGDTVVPVIQPLGKNEEPVRVQSDHLVKVPAGISNSPIPTTIRGRRRGRPRKRKRKRKSRRPQNISSKRLASSTVLIPSVL